MSMVSKYLQRVGIAISVLFNVLLGGYSNQSFSARNYAWKRANRPNLVWLIDTIFWFDQSHCMHCWLYWYTRKNRRVTNDNDLRS